MAFYGGFGFLQVVADKLGSKSRPGCKEPCVNSLDPCAGDWAKASFVEVCYDVAFVVDFIDVVGLGCWNGLGG